jgi:hypothetical protein
MNINKMRALFPIVISVLSLFIISGCGSARFTTTLKQQSVAPSELAGHKLKIVSVANQQIIILSSTRMSIPFASADEYMDLAMERYPALFSREPSALPVAVSIRDEYQSESMAVPLITLLLSLGTLPGYPFDTTMEVNTEVVFSNNAFREFCVGTVRFERSDVRWATVYTPFGLIPVLGHSDLPKVSGVVGQQFFVESSNKLTMLSTIDAIVQAAHDCGVQAFNKIQKEP